MRIQLDYKTLKRRQRAERQTYPINLELVRLMLLKTLTPKRARRKLPRVLESLDQLRDSPLRGLAKTLNRWLEPIESMCQFSKNNGIT